MGSVDTSQTLSAHAGKSAQHGCLALLRSFDAQLSACVATLGVSRTNLLTRSNTRLLTPRHDESWPQAVSRAQHLRPALHADMRPALRQPQPRDMALRQPCTMRAVMRPCTGHRAQGTGESESQHAAAPVPAARGRPSPSGSAGRPPAHASLSAASSACSCMKVGRAAGSSEKQRRPSAASAAGASGGNSGRTPSTTTWAPRRQGQGRAGVSGGHSRGAPHSAQTVALRPAPGGKARGRCCARALRAPQPLHARLSACMHAAGTDREAACPEAHLVDDEQLRGALEGPAPHQRGEHQHAERPHVRGLRAGPPVSARARGRRPSCVPSPSHALGPLGREETRHARAPGRAAGAPRRAAAAHAARPCGRGPAGWRTEDAAASQQAARMLWRPVPLHVRG
jgi:hypothetical protein